MAMGLKNVVVTLAVCLCAVTVSGVQTVSEQEVRALLDLFNSTHGTHWSKHDGWGNMSISVCDWYGVGCNSDKTHVTTLSMQANNLSGMLPASLGDLHRLTILDLSSGNMLGPVPRSIANMTHLTQLDLGYNYLSSLPPLGTLTQLMAIDVADNRMTGNFPVSVCNLTSLVLLELSDNQLSGTLPPCIGRLTKLVSLSLASNNFTGQIPNSMGNLVNVNTLTISSNNLSGTLPASLGNMTMLNVLDVADMSLHGTIPSTLGALQTLSTLNLQHNGFSGSLPKEIGNMSSLQYLDVSDNQLSGVVPPELGQLSSLALFKVSSNNFTGPLPEFLTRLPSLGLVIAAHNHFTSVPANLGYTSGSKITILDISYNDLTGEFPLGPLAGTSKSITSLNAAGNYFCSVPTQDNLPQTPQHAVIILSENLLPFTTPPKGWVTGVCDPRKGMQCDLSNQRPYYVANGTCHPKKTAGSVCSNHTECADPGMCMGGHCCSIGVGHACVTCLAEGGSPTCGKGNCSECSGADMELTQDGVCERRPSGALKVNVLNMSLTLGLPLLVYLVASALDWYDKQQRKDEEAAGRARRRPRRYVPLFWAVFGLYHQCFDYNWLYANVKAWVDHDLPPHSQSQLRLFHVGVLLFVFACVITVITNIVILKRLVSQLSKSSQDPDVSRLSGWRRHVTFTEWRTMNFSVFWSVALVSCLKLSVFKVLYCGACGLKSLSAPVRLKDARGLDTDDGRSLRLVSSIVKVVEDLPQLIGTLLVNTATGKWDNYTDATTMIMSVVSLVVSVAIAVDVALLQGKSGKEQPLTSTASSATLARAPTPATPLVQT